MLTFYNELSSARPYNLHGHTQFCDGRNTMQEFAEAAVEAGFSHYGFSPHSPICVPSPCNMPKDSVGDYLDEIYRLREKYQEKIRIYASMGIDYLGSDWGPATDYFQQIPLDYRIGSVHFVPTQEGTPVDIDGSPERFALRLDECFRGDLRYVVDKFFEQSIMMVENGGFDIIGHLDKIALNASHVDPEITSAGWYKSLLDELIDKTVDHKITVEINTKHFAKYGFFFPTPSVWPELKNRGAQIVINSDAHYTDLINASRAEAIAMLADAG